jgi:hypothetical protein
VVPVAVVVEVVAEYAAVEEGIAVAVVMVAIVNSFLDFNFF